MIKYGAPMKKIYIVRKKKETQVQVEDTIEIQIEMVIDKVFEFVEDARNWGHFMVIDEKGYKTFWR